MPAIMKRVPEYFLAACLLTNAGCLYFYSYVNLNTYDESKVLFLTSFRAGNVGSGLVIILLLTLILTHIKMRSSGRVCCYILMLMSGSVMFNNLLELTRNGIFSLLLPTVLLITAFTVIYNGLTHK